MIEQKRPEIFKPRAVLELTRELPIADVINIVNTDLRCSRYLALEILMTLIREHGLLVLFAGRRPLTTSLVKGLRAAQRYDNFEKILILVPTSEQSNLPCPLAGCKVHRDAMRAALKSHGADYGGLASWYGLETLDTKTESGEKIRRRKPLKSETDTAILIDALVDHMENENGETPSSKVAWARLLRGTFAHEIIHEIKSRDLVLAGKISLDYERFRKAFSRRFY